MWDVGYGMWDVGCGMRTQLDWAWVVLLVSFPVANNF